MTMVMHVAVWQPWWLDSVSTHAERWRVKPMVEVLDSIDTGEDVADASEAHTKIVESSPFQCSQRVSVPSLRDIGFRGDPSPLLPCSLVALLFGYGHTMRSFNGDWSADACAAAGLFVTVAGLGHADAPPSSVKQALGDASLRLLQSPDVSVALTHATRASLVSGAAADAAAMLSSRHYVLDALADSVRMLAAAEADARESSSSRDPRHGAATQSADPTAKRKPSRAARLVLAAQKKLQFFTSWVAQCVGELEVSSLRDSVVDVQVEREREHSEHVR